MKTMITRNNVLRHNGTMRCLLGRNGPQEFRVITPRHGLLLRGSEWKHVGAGGSMRKARKTVEANREPVEAMEVVGSHGSRWKVGGRQGRGRKGCRRVGRGAGGPEEVRKAVGKCGRGRKAQEVTVHYITFLLKPSPRGQKTVL